MCASTVKSPKMFLAVNKKPFPKEQERKWSTADLMLLPALGKSHRIRRGRPVRRANCFLFLVLFSLNTGAKTQIWVTYPNSPPYIPENFSAELSFKQRLDWEKNFLLSVEPRGCDASHYTMN